MNVIMKCIKAAFGLETLNESIKPTASTLYDRINTEWHHSQLLPHAQSDAYTLGARDIIMYLGNWDQYPMHDVGIAESRLSIYNGIMKDYHDGKISCVEVDRKLVSWLAGLDNNNMSRVLENIK